MEYREKSSTKVDGLVIGILAAFDPDGHPLVAFAENSSELPRKARSVTSIDADAVGREVVMMFENGCSDSPVIMGLLQTPATTREAASSAACERSASPLPASLPAGLGAVDRVTVDGERTLITAEKEIVLQCGDSSITLHRSGKIVIRGKDILNRSSGSNRIKGASIQLN